MLIPTTRDSHSMDLNLEAKSLWWRNGRRYLIMRNKAATVCSPRVNRQKKNRTPTAHTKLISLRKSRPPLSKRSRDWVTKVTKRILRTNLFVPHCKSIYVIYVKHKYVSIKCHRSKNWIDLNLWHCSWCYINMEKPVWPAYQPGQ